VTNISNKLFSTGGAALAARGILGNTNEGTCEKTFHANSTPQSEVRTSFQKSNVASFPINKAEVVALRKRLTQSNFNRKPTQQENPEIVKNPNGYYAKTATKDQRISINREKLSAHKIIVKIGTNTVMSKDDINYDFVKRLAIDVKFLKEELGKDVTLVVSGAVAMGRIREPNHKEILEKRLKKVEHLHVSDKEKDGLRQKYTIEHKQGLAGIGQPVLYARISDVFLKEAGLQLCQTLVTQADMVDIRDNPKTHNNLYTNQYSKSIVTVINANDTLCSSQIVSGDNDNLAVRIGAVIEADTVVLLSDIDGIYTDNPKGSDDPSVHHLPYFDKSNMAYAYEIAKGATDGGTGGMLAKVKAVDEIAFPNNMSVIISLGDVEYPLRDLFDTDSDTSKTSTWFIPHLEQKTYPQEKAA
jgi:glutamate 5-kinase